MTITKLIFNLIFLLLKYGNRQVKLVNVECGLTLINFNILLQNKNENFYQWRKFNIKEKLEFDSVVLVEKEIIKWVIK